MFSDVTDKFSSENSRAFSQVVFPENLSFQRNTAGILCFISVPICVYKSGITSELHDNYSLIIICIRYYLSDADPVSQQAAKSSSCRQTPPWKEVSIENDIWRRTCVSSRYRWMPEFWSFLLKNWQNQYQFGKTNKIARARRASAICGLWKQLTSVCLFQIARENHVIKCYTWKNTRWLIKHKQSARIECKNNLFQPCVRSKQLRTIKTMICNDIFTSSRH